MFEAVREKAGLRAPPERPGGMGRLTVEEGPRFLNQAFSQGRLHRADAESLVGDYPRVRAGVAQDRGLSLAERVIAIRHGKGPKQWELLIRRDPPQLLHLYTSVRLAVSAAGERVASAVWPAT